MVKKERYFEEGTKTLENPTKKLSQQFLTSRSFVVEIDIKTVRKNYAPVYIK